MIFDAEYLARGWLSAALASSKDPDRPQLHRTVSIEGYPEGVRLAATDSYVLVWAWVPTLDHVGDPEPSWDEAPAMRAVVMDTHGRGKGLLAHLLKLATAKDALPVEVTLTLGLTGEGSEGQMPGIEASYVALDHPGSERVELPCYEGEFISWRKVVAEHSPSLVSGIALTPSLVGPLLSGLGKLNHGPVVWQFGGEHHPARFDLPESDPAVAGLAMGVRWDFGTNTPRDTEDE